MLFRSPRRARAPPPAKRRPVNCTRVDAGEGRGEGTRDTRHHAVCTAQSHPTHAARTNFQICPTTPRPRRARAPLLRKDARSTAPQIAPNEGRSVRPKCRPSRLRVRSQRSDSPSARGRRGLVREGRDSVLATDLAHHRLEADGVGHAGTRRARSLSHPERTTHQSSSRVRRSEGRPVISGQLASSTKTPPSLRGLVNQICG